MSYVILWLLCGVVAGSIYSSKGRSAATAFIVGLLLGPIGVLLAALTPADTASVERKQVKAGAMKKCPHCGELVRSEATVCRYCQRDLPAVGPLAAAPPGTVARITPSGSGGYTCSNCNGFIRSDATTCKHCKKPLILPAAVYAAMGTSPGEPPTG